MSRLQRINCGACNKLMGHRLGDASSIYLCNECVIIAEQWCVCNGVTDNNPFAAMLTYAIHTRLNPPNVHDGNCALPPPDSWYLSTWGPSMHTKNPYCATGYTVRIPEESTRLFLTDDVISRYNELHSAAKIGDEKQ